MDSQIITIVSLTVISGTSVFVLGQIINKFFIEPIHNQSKIFGEIGNILILYAHIINNLGAGPKKVRQEVSQKLRELASRIMMRTYMIKGYWCFEKLKIVPKRNNISEVHHNLIGLSNGILRDDLAGLKYILEWQNNIKKKLNLKIE